MCSVGGTQGEGLQDGAAGRPPEVPRARQAGRRGQKVRTELPHGGLLNGSGSVRCSPVL
jgi:hypothetical protein